MIRQNGLNGQLYDLEVPDYQPILAAKATDSIASQYDVLETLFQSSKTYSACIRR